MGNQYIQTIYINRE